MLGTHRQAAGTLGPQRVESLRALVPVTVLRGISIPRAAPLPTVWQTAATYLPNGVLIVGNDGNDLAMPFLRAHGGGFRCIVLLGRCWSFSLRWTCERCQFFPALRRGLSPAITPLDRRFLLTLVQEIGRPPRGAGRRSGYAGTCTPNRLVR